jgi:hypothetical protein
LDEIELVEAGERENCRENEDDAVADGGRSFLSKLLVVLGKAGKWQTEAAAA